MKQKERMVIVKFILFCLAMAVLGFVVGISAKRTDLEALLSQFAPEQIGIALFVVYAVFVAVSIPAMLLPLRKAKRMAADWDGSNEEDIHRIEMQLNKPMVAANVSMIVCYLLFTCCCYYLVPEMGLYGLSPCILMALGMVCFTVTMQKTVTLEKQLNPEKKGSPLSVHFRKEWVNSCDELEKIQLWQTGYAGYVAGSNTCMVLWVLSTLGAFIFHTGILPVLCVCIIWLAMTIASMREASRLTAA